MIIYGIMATDERLIKVLTALVGRKSVIRLFHLTLNVL